MFYVLVLNSKTHIMRVLCVWYECIDFWICSCYVIKWDYFSFIYGAANIYIYTPQQKLRNAKKIQAFCILYLSRCIIDFDTPSFWPTSHIVKPFSSSPMAFPLWCGLNFCLGILIWKLFLKPLQPFIYPICGRRHCELPRECDIVTPTQRCE